MKKLTVLPEKCIACGKCYLNYPQAFDCDDTGIAFAVDDVSPHEIESATPAMYECPTRAIYLEEE